VGKIGKLAVLSLIVLLLTFPLAATLVGATGNDGDDRTGDRSSWTVSQFEEHSVPVGVNFEGSSENSTYHVSIPNSATVTAASVTLGGVERYSLRGTPTDFGDVPGVAHMAYRGENGAYPPVTSPSNYNQLRFDGEEEVAIESLDGQNVTSGTPQGLSPPPFHYPYHMFDMLVNKTDMVRLELSWWGFGQNLENDTITNGAMMYVWNYTGNKWLRTNSYAANDSRDQVRMFSHTLMNPYDYTDGFGHVNILVFGMHDEANAVGWPDIGYVSTDYVVVSVLRNDTLQRPSDVSLAIGDDPTLWSLSGPFTGSVTLDDSHGFKDALQAYVDSIPPSPQAVSAPFVFNVRQPTWGLVRVSALSVTIREVNNQPPEFLGAEDVVMTEDMDLSKGLDLALSFDDDYNNADLTYSVAFEENASLVHAVIHVDGHNVNFITVADDWSGELTFRFSGMDIWGLITASDNITVIVNPIGDPPWLDDPGDMFIDEDVPVELNLSFGDPDLPYGDTLAFSDDTSIFDIDPTSGQIAFTPSQEEVGRYNVTLTLTDGQGNAASVTIAISITNVNDRPSILDPGALVAFEDELFSYNFTALDEDGDRQFAWTLVGSVGSMFMGPQNGRLTWVPEGEHVGTVNVSVISRDPMGAADQINVSIEVVNVNDPPELAELDRAQLTEGELFSYTVVIFDPDLEEDPSESHTFSLDPELFSILPSGIVAFTPTNDDVGTHMVNLTVSDAGGLSHTLLWEIVVININQPPVIESVEDQIWHEDEQALILIISTDPDLGDLITFSDTTSMFDIDPRTGEINFTPAQNNVGRHEVRIHVQDEAGLYSDVYFIVNVLSHNDAPTVAIRVETLKEHLKEGDMLSLAAVAEDEDNHKSDLHYLWFLNGKQVGDGDVITLDDLKPGNHSVELRVDDGDNTVSGTYDFDVEAVEETFSWIWAVVAVIVIVIVAFIGIKVFKAVQDTGQGDPTEEVPVAEEPEEEVVPVSEDNPFKNW